MTKNWAYVSERLKGKLSYYVCSAKPLDIYKEEDGTWTNVNDGWWFEVDPVTKRVPLGSLKAGPLEDRVFAFLLDLSEIPLPKENEEIIVVIQKINQSTNYYL